MQILFKKNGLKRFVFQFALLIGTILLPIFTFVFGTVATLLWDKLSPPTVTLCQLEQNPDWYKWRMVRVEAEAFSSFGAVFIIDKNCGVLEVAGSGVWLAENYEPPAEARKLYTERDLGAPREHEVFRARLLVTGRFDPNATPGRWTPKATIRATNIELKSEIKTEPAIRREE